MDQGIAALIGAALGGSAAWGAALITFRGARYQADAQAKSAHEQWLRQIRRDTYAAFIHAARTSNIAFEQARKAWSGGDRQALRNSVTVMAGCVEETELALSKLELEAPENIKQPATALCDAVRHSLRDAQGWLSLNEPSARLLDVGSRRCVNVSRDIQELLTLCRASLHNG